MFVQQRSKGGEKEGKKLLKQNVTGEDGQINYFCFGQLRWL